MSTSSSQSQKTDYTQCDILVQEIISIAQQYIIASSSEKIHNTIMDTYIFAREAHEGQYRKSGEPYISHPLSATKLLLTLKPDIVSIQACILHDVIEDTEKTEDDIRAQFGDHVAHICQGLSKLSAIKYRGEERTIESLRKMLIAMVDDLRVIIVKLADRLHNMQTLHFHPESKKQERIALETLNIYAPIADRLGIFGFKEMLETECFRILHPDDYYRITTELKSIREEQEFFMKKIKKTIRDAIDPSIAILDISYRVKAPLSIYKKLKRKGLEHAHVNDLYDLFAVRIITNNVRHCYEILGVLHNVFTPMPKRFKDYIALPKENGYQSLHTTVVGLFPDLRSQPTEIQIRTQDMHEQAEVGIAAHFSYSETGKSKATKDSYWVQAIQNIIKENKEGVDFMNDMKVNIFEDQIFVFTPQGDIITLPRGATPIDFAYSIHSDIGNTLAFAKVNGQVVPLDYELHSGQSISIVTDKNKRPRPIWLSFVVTSKAQEHIRQYIHREERGFFVEKGRNILNSYLEKYYGKGLDKDLSILRIIDGAILDSKQKEDILVQIGNLSRKPSSILRAIHDDIIAASLGKRIIATQEEEAKKKKEEKKKLLEQKEKEQEQEAITVIVGRERNIPYKIAQCCTPTAKNKKIVGIIGQGIVTIHRIDCGNVKKVAIERRIPSKWSNDVGKRNINFTIECIFHDRKGILMEFTQIFFEFNLNIAYFHTDTLENGLVQDTFTLETENDDDYYIFDCLEERLQFTFAEELTEIRLVEMH